MLTRRSFIPMARELGTWFLVVSLVALAACKPASSSPSAPSAPVSSAALPSPSASAATSTDAAMVDEPIDAAPPPVSASLDTRLRARAKEVLGALAAKDMTAFAALAHPTRGVRFSPYSYVDDADVVLTPVQLRGALSSVQIRNWGAEDGSGAPIKLTFAAYSRRFVMSRDFRAAPQVTVDHGASTGNTSDNLTEAYPGTHFVELYFPNDPKSGAMDWESLRLVFAEADTTLWLVGVVHGEWTI